MQTLLRQTDWLRPLHGLSELASGILANGFAFASLATGFGGTTNEKVDNEAKRPASEANAHVGRSPGEVVVHGRLYANPLGPQRKTESLKNENGGFRSLTP